MVDLGTNVESLVKRHYTKDLVDYKKKDKNFDVFDLFDWQEVDVVIKDYKTGKNIVEMLKIQFPKHFSQNACDIIASKYFRKINDTEIETSYKQVVNRMVTFWVASALDEKLVTKEEALVLYDELAYMMCMQMWAPNSPQWFNTGIKIAYGISGEKQGHFYFDEKAGKVVEATDSYTRTQGSACFIVGVDDSLLGPKSITNQLETETRLFKFGSGVGTNWSNIRGEGEPLSGGGKSSGLMSFLDVFNANAGAIKSGGTCLAPYQKVFTENGAVEVKELAKMEDGFIALSYDPPTGRYKAKRAKAWLAGNKKVIRITTDKGSFELTYDHPVKLSTGEFVKVEDLKAGMSLFSGNVNNNAGYMRVGLKDGNAGKRRWHQMILEDLYNEDLRLMVVHHKDGNKLRNERCNLDVMSQVQHGSEHNLELVAEGKHIFQNNYYGKSGEANGMHSTSDFWLDHGRAECYKNKQSEIMKERGTAGEMQVMASNQKMLNTGYKLINAGYNIDNFIYYRKAREELIGRMANPKKTLESINSRFGSYDGYLEALRKNNHRVVSIVEVGNMDVYDVEVECTTKDDKSPETGHNFLIWSLDNESDYFGSGIVVANTRRAAKMNCLDINHPDIVKFISWKAKEEQKVRDLGKMGYDTHFDGEAYATVGGQNANNSVRVDDKFMDGLTDKDLSHMDLVNRTNGKVARTVEVSKLWDDIAKAAWECGDPGLQFDTTINDWHTCPAGEDGDIGKKHNRINASNPCSEYMFLDDTACNLASINLMKFYDGNTFDLEGYLHCVSLCQIVLESTIHWGQFPTEEIARKSYMFRTTGLGYANLGALLMNMGYGYDTDEARAVSAGLLSLLTGQSYVASAWMASKVGPFKYFDINKKHMMKVIRNHRYISMDGGVGVKDLAYKPYALDEKLTNKAMPGLFEAVSTSWIDAEQLGNKYGYRNAQVSVLAPTGTISFAMDCTTTSSEPFFGNMVWKKLVGGSGMMLVNDCIESGLKKLGYQANQILDIIEYVEENNGLIEGAPHIKEEHLVVFDTANPASGGKRFIEPMGHVRMMACLTPYVSGAISKTVNMPENATVADIKEVYYQSWKMGVKAIALYRDGSKASQPLNVYGADGEDKKLEDYTYSELVEHAGNLEAVRNTDKEKMADFEETLEKANRRIAQLEEEHGLHREKPKGIRTANVHEAEMSGIKLYITVSRYEDGKIAEVYISAGRQGSLVKGLLDSLSTTISEMIQYGIEADSIAKMYRGQKYEPSGFVNGHPYIKMADSLSDLISKVIDIELGDYTFCQVKPEIKKQEPTIETLVKSGTVEVNNDAPKKEKGVGTRIYGQTCSTCGSDHMLKNGTCKVCQDCGTTTGCS